MNYELSILKILADNKPEGRVTGASEVGDFVNFRSRKVVTFNICALRRTCDSQCTNVPNEFRTVVLVEPVSISRHGRYRNTARFYCTLSLLQLNTFPVFTDLMPVQNQVPISIAHTGSFLLLARINSLLKQYLLYPKPLSCFWHISKQ